MIELDYNGIILTGILATSLFEVIRTIIKEREDKKLTQIVLLP
jgi:hypothetical protein